MTRRVIVTIVAIVAAALVVASVVTFVLVRVEAQNQARTELRRQAVRLATRVETVQAPGALTVVVRALRLEGAGVIRLGDDGSLRGELPPGVARQDIDVDALRAGKAHTGRRAGVIFAAAPAQRGETLVVVLTRDVGAAQVALGPWFVVAMLATLVVAVAVAVNLTRRLTRPLRQAQDATRRIAAGDLSVRVPEEQADGSELAGLARSINVMAASLERSRGMERQFLLSVSHDLRTPLTSIRGFAQALIEGRAPIPPAPGRSSARRRPGSSAWSATCWSWPTSTPAASPSTSAGPTSPRWWPTPPKVSGRRPTGPGWSWRFRRARRTQPCRRWPPTRTAWLRSSPTWWRTHSSSPGRTSR